MSKQTQVELAEQTVRTEFKEDWRRGTATLEQDVGAAGAKVGMIAIEDPVLEFYVRFGKHRYLAGKVEV